MSATVRITVGASSGIILWSANHEVGDFSEWEGVWNSGNASAAISTEQAHSPPRSAKLTVNVSGGTRLAVWGDAFPDTIMPDAYFSTWYYFPQLITAPVWWNVFQWKRAWQIGSTRSSDPVYDVNVGNRSDGSMRFHLYKHVGNDGNYDTAGVGTIATAPAGMNIPVGRWVHLECLYTWRTTATGEIRGWQDGVQLWHVTGLKTEFTGAKYDAHVDHPRQWTVNNYYDNTTPPSHSLYVDDAAISTGQIGVGEPPPPPPPPPSGQIEAESASLVAPMVSVSDPSASGGQYITSNTSSSGTATFTLNVPAAGNYTIVGRVWGDNNGSDSFYYTIDSQTEEIWHLNPSQSAALYGVWREVAISKVGTGTAAMPQFDPYVINFSAGTHTLRFRAREATARLDWIKLVAGS